MSTSLLFTPAPSKERTSNISLSVNAVSTPCSGLSLEESMVLLLESSNARVVVSTLGSQGSVLVKREGDDLSDLR